jgi:hypothetical protein
MANIKSFPTMTFLQGIGIFSTNPSCYLAKLKNLIKMGQKRLLRRYWTSSKLPFYGTDSVELKPEIGRSRD